MFSVIEKYSKVVHESMNISCFEKMQCTNQEKIEKFNSKMLKLSYL